MQSHISRNACVWQQDLLEPGAPPVATAQVQCQDVTLACCDSLTAGKRR